MAVQQSRNISSPRQRYATHELVSVGGCLARVGWGEISIAPELLVVPTAQSLGAKSTYVRTGFGERWGVKPTRFCNFVSILTKFDNEHDVKYVTAVDHSTTPVLGGATRPTPRRPSDRFRQTGFRAAGAGSAFCKQGSFWCLSDCCLVQSQKKIAARLLSSLWQFLA